MLQNILSNISKEVEQNLDTRIKLLQLEGVDIGAYWGGRILLGVLIILMAGIVLMCFSLASAIALGQVLGGIVYGFLSVGLIYLILIPLLWLARKRLFIRPVIQWISRKLDDEQPIWRKINSRSSLKIAKGRFKADVDASNRNLQAQLSYLKDAMSPEQLGLEVATAVQNKLS